jgi:hypothetical protein
MRECEVFRRMLERVLPIPEGLPVKYVVRTHPHDFGTYREVSVRHSGDDAAACDFAFQVESSVPDGWTLSRSRNSRTCSGGRLNCRRFPQLRRPSSQRIERNLTACPTVCRLMSDTTCGDRPSRVEPDQAIGGTHRGAPLAGLEKDSVRVGARNVCTDPWCVAGAAVYTG